jgi:hypothetical protein
LTQEEYLGFRCDDTDPAGGLDAIETRQADVKQDYIGLLFLGLLDCFQSIGRDAYYVELWLTFQQSTHAAANYFGIIDY